MKRESAPRKKTPPKKAAPPRSLARSRSRKGRSTAAPIAPPYHATAFREVLVLIERARHRAFQAVNTGLIDLYWRVGEFISRKIETAARGDGVVGVLAHYFKKHHPEIPGFTRRNLFRMRQFFETYRHHKKVSALQAQLPWTQNLLILARSKRAEEREFCLSASSSLIADYKTPCPTPPSSAANSTNSTPSPNQSLIRRSGESPRLRKIGADERSLPFRPSSPVHRTSITRVIPTTLRALPVVTF